MFGSLLNVVENKLVEVQELDEIKKELENWRGAVYNREIKRQQTLDQVQSKVAKQMSEFRQQFTSILAASEAAVNNKIERVEYEMRGVSLQTEFIKRELEEMKHMLKRELVGAFANKIEGLEGQMSLLQKKVELNCNNLRQEVTSGLSHVKDNLNNDFTTSERRVAAELELMRSLSQSDLVYVHKQMQRMDHLLDS